MARKSIEWFAEQMEKKLVRDDDKKAGWEDGRLSAKEAFDCLITEVFELHAAMCGHLDRSCDETAKKVIMEAADVSNFAMMIATMHDPEMGQLERGRERERVVADELVVTQEPIIVTPEPEYRFRDWWGVDDDLK